MSKTYVISSWDRSLVTTREFYKTLRKVANYYKAEMILLPTNLNDTGLIPRELKFFNILTSDLRLNNNLVIKILPVNAMLKSPLSPWRGAFPEHSTILPGIRKELITETSPKLAKQLISPGAIGHVSSTPPEGSRTVGASREIARNFIRPAALIVTVKDEDMFITRHVTGAPDGSIYDLNKRFHFELEEPEEHHPDMNQGDAHVAEIDMAAWRANDEMLEVLKPRQLFVNDAFSGVSINRHEMHKGNKLALSGMSLKEEADLTHDFLKSQASKVQQLVYLHSNHDNFLEYYLDGDPKFWSYNGNKGIASNLYALRDQGKNPIVELLRQNEISNLTYWSDAKPYYSGKVAVAHGDIGIGGARGNFRANARAYNYYSQGHTHSPEILMNSMCVGTLSRLDLGYNKGASSWLHSNGLIHPDGSMQLLPIIYGEWR